jgi:hypothetical protein
MGGTSPIKFGYEVATAMPMGFVEKKNCYYKKENPEPELVKRQISTFVIDQKNY